jgi:DNA-binding transcriptional MerR regulator
MGAWGTGILHNDTTADIWVEFKELYNSGLSVKEIRQQLEKEYQPEKDEENYSEIWTGIAYGQWMCGALEDYTFEKVKNATDEKWQTLWAEDKKLLQKRIKAISEFIIKIQTPRPTSLKRKKIVIRQAFYQAGDIIGIEINPDHYVAAIVTKQKDYGNDGENTIVFTDCFFTKSVTDEDVLQANIFYLDLGGTNN